MTKSAAYAILEITHEYMSEKMLPSTLKKAYRKAVKKYHPDHNPDADPDAIKLVNEAYSRICSDFFIQEDTITQKHKSEKKQKANRDWYTRSKREYKTLEKMYWKFAPCDDISDVAQLIAWLINTGRASNRMEIWVTVDLRVYAIKDLATQHLVNIKPFMEKNGKDIAWPETYKNICEEIKKRNVKFEATVVGKTKIKLHF